MAKIRQIMRKNCRLTFRSIAEEVDIDRETVRKILTEDLDMRKVCAKMVPKELTEEQKQRRVFATKQITVLEHPAYSPNLAHSDFFSVPENKGNIERKAF